MMQFYCTLKHEDHVAKNDRKTQQTVKQQAQSSRAELQGKKGQYLIILL
jgi:hypothetical protein